MYIDVNCSVGEWPFRDLTITSSAAIDQHLEKEGIEIGLVSPVDAILAGDPYEKNASFIEATVGIERLYPVPVINPRVRRWVHTLQAYSEQSVKAIKLYPNYHGYKLTDPECEECLAAVAEANVVVMLPLRVEDERFHHPLMQVPPFGLAELCTCAQSHPKVTFIGLNGYRNELVGDNYAKSSNLFLDIAFAERDRTVEDLLETIAADRLLFGSNTPFFTTRAATMKVVHARIDDSVKEAITSENAKRILGW